MINFLLILGVSAITTGLTIDNIKNLLLGHLLYAPKTNIVGLYFCGLIWGCFGLYQVVSIPSRVKHQRSRKETLMICLMIMEIGGLDKLVKRGRRHCILAGIAILLAIYFQKQIGWGF